MKCEHVGFWDFVQAHPLLALGDGLVMWIIWCVTIVWCTRDLRRAKMKE